MTEVQPRPKFIDDEVRAADKALVKALLLWNCVLSQRLNVVLLSLLTHDVLRRCN